MRCKLRDAVEFNPTEHLAKGTIAKKVSMDKLAPFTRNITSWEVMPYGGGAKFRNADTIMARITPCLENGKTAQVNILDDDEVGYGSTEFIVWRARPGTTDGDYIYYLSQSTGIRDVAVKSMVGSSGRQRVQQTALDNYVIDLPPLAEQIEIGYTLKILDDKIALNTKINRNLEQMTQAIFKSWFVDFGPWGGVMPEGWVYAPLESLCALIVRGITPKYDDNCSQIVINQKCIRNHMLSMELARKHIPKAVNEKWLRYGDILINSTGEGTLGRVAQFFLHQDDVTVDSHVMIVRPAKAKLLYYLGRWCLDREEEFAAMAAGSTGQTELPRERVRAMEVLVPGGDSLAEYTELVAPLVEKQISNQNESARLADLRDTLLPRLMSGKLLIPGYMTTTGIR